jgi:nucleotide-binding universal stress UspA family protein
MERAADLVVLVPVDVSEPDAPDLRILDHLGAVRVVLLGYFPVPDQADPALLKADREEAAAARLHDLAAHPGEVEEVLVFTHDREATVDRVADERGCDAVLVPGTVPDGALERVLVPIRGEVNVDRIIAVTADLLHASDATATLFHAAVEDADPSHGELLLRGAADRFVDYGVEETRLDRRLSTAADPAAEIVRLADEYDLVVFGETEPTLVEQIVGERLARMVDEVGRPALVVRNVA